MPRARPPPSYRCETLNTGSKAVARHSCKQDAVVEGERLSPKGPDPERALLVRLERADAPEPESRSAPRGSPREGRRTGRSLDLEEGDGAVVSSEYIVQIRGLVVGYPDRQGMGRAVDDVDLLVRRGEVLGLVGESGCGKTTLGLTLLKQNKPGKVLAGDVEVDSVKVLSLEGEDLRRYRWETTSMIFQSAMNALNPVKTIEAQIVQTMVQHSRIGKKQAREKVASLLRMVDIDPSRASSYPHQLSGGMKQRVVIAMSLCLEPKLVIADEPSTALDVVVQASILRTIKRLKARLGLTVILITHDISILHGMADRIAVMYAGKVVEIGPTAEILTHPRHPYTQALLKAVPTIGMREEIRGIPGALPSLFGRPSGCRFHPRCPYAFAKCAEKEPLVENDERDAACWLVKE